MIEISDAGMLPVKVTTGGTVHEQQIDALECVEELKVIREQFVAKPAGVFTGKLVEFWESKGFPRLSHLAADKLTAAVFDAVTELKKDAPDSTNAG